MAVHYVGIDRMLADMQWSTKSAYQIQSTFYIISQRSAGELLSQTSLKPSLGKMVPVGQRICIEMSSAASRQQGLAAECCGNGRNDVGSNLRYLFEGKMNHQAEPPRVVQHGLPAVFRVVFRTIGGFAERVCRRFRRMASGRISTSLRTAPAR
jgi:hypothetical protein